ncbi:MAG: tetratricopeptide repeat protein [Desulfovibrionaceae bacterium]|nr:tetratricopeptide repeat protein [Desulfovibrionaceae bacterium]
MEENTLNLRQSITQSEDTLKQIALSLGYNEADLNKLQERIQAGEPLYKILNLSASVLEDRYKLAYKLYQSGQWQEAEDVFRWLCFFNGTAKANWMGLGASLQGQEKWEEALTAYGLALAWSEEGQIEPLYYIGICHYMLGHKEEAKQAFEETVVGASFKSSKERELVKRACILLDKLEVEN